MSPAGGGRRAPVHRTKGQLQITQSGARQSTSRCTPANRPPPRTSPGRPSPRTFPPHSISIGNPYPTAVNDGFYITPSLAFVVDLLH